MTKPRIIALLTDFGPDSHYVGVTKGIMLGIAPQSIIVDLTHSIRPQDITEASFVLASTYRYFLPNTIFVIVVDPGVGGQRSIICMETKDYIFLAPDNGILSVVSERSKRVINVSNHKYFRPEISSTFHGRDIFAPVAGHLARGVSPARLGPAMKRIKKLDLFQPQVKGKSILGEIVFIDRFGNLITNINRSLIQNLVKTSRYDKVRMQIRGQVIQGISRTYGEVKPGGLLALLGSSDYLEIAQNSGNAQARLGARRRDKVIIKC